MGEEMTAEQLRRLWDTKEQSVALSDIMTRAIFPEFAKRDSKSEFAQGMIAATIAIGDAIRPHWIAMKLPASGDTEK